MTKFGIITLLFLALAFFVGGCASSRLETDYGTSHKLAIMEQTVNPEAEKNLGPVEGIDGQAAQFILDRYHRGFEKPVPVAPVLSIGIAGGYK
ncbi:MAG: pilus assembly protein [Syntrophorhabdaceae bacterium]